MFNILTPWGVLSGRLGDDINFAYAGAGTNQFVEIVRGKRRDTKILIDDVS
jgi:hypothetical protein